MDNNGTVNTDNNGTLYNYIDKQLRFCILMMFVFIIHVLCY